MKLELKGMMAERENVLGQIKKNEETKLCYFRIELFWNQSL